MCDSEKMRVLDLFTRVWGAGPSTAEQWYQKGLRSLMDVEEREEGEEKKSTWSLDQEFEPNSVKRIEP